MSNDMLHQTDHTNNRRIFFAENDFMRSDDTDDREYYSRDRFVQHLDSLALSTVKTVISTLIVEKNPAVLDLMASWDSHIPSNIKSQKVVGLGLNESELRSNKALTEFVLHDLNADTSLPFSDASFDVVLNVVSVDYMTKPVEIFREVNRILKPGGLFLVIFSNRYFPPKVVNIWRNSGEEERIILVEEFFRIAGGYEKPDVFISKGRPRPESDKYAHLGIPSDPIYAVYADKKCEGKQQRARPVPTVAVGESINPEEVKRRKKEVRTTLRCPYCGERMKKWAVPHTPFSTWDAEFMYICFNDQCPYLVQGWDAMQAQGNIGSSYRCMYNPHKDVCMPVPVPGIHALKEGIVEN